MNYYLILTIVFGVLGATAVYFASHKYERRNVEVKTLIDRIASFVLFSIFSLMSIFIWVLVGGIIFIGLTSDWTDAETLLIIFIPIGIICSSVFLYNFRKGNFDIFKKKG